MLRIRNFILVAATFAVLGIAAAPVAHTEESDNDCARLDMEVFCVVSPSKTVLVGDPFEVTATVKNTGDRPLDNVQLVLEGGNGVTMVGNDTLELICPHLEPGESREIRRRFVSDEPGERRVSASARDKLGWAAAGCYCGVLIKGLPAIQLEMIDVDINRQPKGIFEMDENFIYILKVENDVGTALTPDLKIVFNLPEYLVFVEGTGDRGATISGNGRSAESSSFVLRPNQVQNFELVVKVVAVPKRNLMQARVAVVTADGGQELAQETESTTLKKRAN